MAADCWPSFYNFPFKRFEGSGMKKRFISVASLVLLAVTVTFNPAISNWGGKAQTEIRTEGEIALQAAMASSNPVSAIVELESEPVVAHQLKAPRAAQLGGQVELESSGARTYESHLAAEQARFETAARLAAPDLRVVVRLRKLANAVSIELPGNQLGQVAALPGVRRVELTQECHASLTTSLPLIGVPTAWEKVGGGAVAGQGIKIAILDSGIDISNPFFSDDGFVAPTGFPRGDPAFTNNKVIVAKVFLPDETATPADEHGHGTHVGGIAAGNIHTDSPIGPLTGIAPKAFLGNYRVLNRDGTGRNDLIARGLEEAVEDGFPIANLSLGGKAGTEFNILDRAVENAVAAGVTVVISAGNSGASGEMSITSPGTVPSAITVTATTNSHTIVPALSVNNPAPVPAGLARIRTTRGIGSASSLESLAWPMEYADVSSIDGQGRGCNALPAGSLNGKVALVERGICTFPVKINTVAEAGASAVIVFNRDISEGADGGSTLLNMDVTGTNIPSLFIGHDDGVALREWLRSHQEAQLNLSLGESPFLPNLTVPTNSTGPTPIGTLKPDLAAPGVFVYSSAIREPNPKGVVDPSGFIAVSGTSQAAPHIAGAAALLKQRNPSWTPQQIKSALVNSAVDPVLTATGTARAGLLSAGAGRVSLARAFNVSATLSPSNMSFGIQRIKKKGGAFTASITITSLLNGRNDFKVSISQLDPDGRVTMSASESSVSLEQGQSAEVTIVISLLKKAERRDYTGYVIFEDPDGQTLRAPFWGRFLKK
jgi:subtilisin family serine protease